MKDDAVAITDSEFLMRVGAVFVLAAIGVFIWLDTCTYGNICLQGEALSTDDLFANRQLGFRFVWLGFFTWAVAHLNSDRRKHKSHGFRWRLMSTVALVLAVGFNRLGSGPPVQALISVSLLFISIRAVMSGLKDRGDLSPIWLSHRVVAARVLLCSLILDFIVVTQDALAEESGLPIDGGDAQVPLAMLRLGRMASAAIPLFLLMHHEVRENAVDKPVFIKWVPKIFLFGAVALPILLVLPAAVWMPLKYAMPLGSDAVLIGVGFTAYWAIKQGKRIEFLGWLLLAISMNMGLLMGAYAFDGPFSAPAFVGDFLDAGRRLLRSSHVEIIVAATLLILADRWRKGVGVFTPQSVAFTEPREGA